MPIDKLDRWQHDHSFDQHQKRPGEARTLWVIAATLLMMVIEIVSGIIFGSMALLADGLHMASHAAALTIAVLAYFYTRRHAHDRRFSFGTGKMNPLGGFSSAVLLAVFALMMVWESVDRLLNPIGIAFNEALLVAFLGLVVNGVSALILDHRDPDQEGQDGHGENDRAGGRGHQFGAGRLGWLDRHASSGWLYGLLRWPAAAPGSGAPAGDYER